MEDSYLIEVNEEDIRQGDVIDCENCPIALAVKRKFPGQSVFAGSSFVAVGDLPTFNLPDIAQTFIRNLLCKLPVEPFDFDLVTPQYARRDEQSTP